MSSFVLSRFPVPRSVFKNVQSFLADLQEKERKFALHVLVSNIINLQKLHRQNLDGWMGTEVDLPCQWIEEHFGEKFRPTSIDPSILTYSNYSTTRHQCRSFAASATLLNLVLEWSPDTAEAASDEPIVNLFDGSPYNVQCPTEWEHGVFTSKLIRAAIQSFESCPFNEIALDEHLRSFKERVQAATGAERDHLERALRNDMTCAMRIRVGSKRGKDSLFRYQPEFRTSRAGRIIEVGGGAQSCSRAMKEALFCDIPDLHNYDLKAAQAFILKQELEGADLPREWIDEYLGTPNAAAMHADVLGISKDSFKRCLYATVMGAIHSKNFDRQTNSIYDCLFEESKGDAARAKELTGKLHAELAPLKVEVDTWHAHLMTGAGCKRVDSTRKRVRTLHNACGQHFKLENERTDKLARKAAAFILQGQEAAFIHHLTALGAANAFTPISNQHDGIVTIGVIPKSAIDTAATSSGLRYAFLEPKAFV